MNPTVENGPAPLDWEVARTADLTMIITIYDDQTDELEDLSGYTFAVVVTDSAGAVATGITVTAVGTDQGQLTLTASDGANTIAAGTYLWSIWTTAPTREPWFEGEFRVLRNLVSA